MDGEGGDRDSLLAGGHDPVRIVDSARISRGGLGISWKSKSQCGRLTSILSF